MSVFDLKTESSELSSSNSGVGKATYRQITPDRNISGNNFSNGDIFYNWSQSANTWASFDRSYMRTRVVLSKADGTTQLTEADNISPNMDMMTSMFQNTDFRINGTEVSRVGSFVSQVNAYKNRQTKSKSWFESIGKMTSLWDAEYELRKSIVTSDGVIKVGYKKDVSTSYLKMGFNADTTTAWTSASNTLTFASVVGLPGSMIELFPVGSRITYPVAINAETAGSTFIVVNGTATTLVLDAGNTIGADAGATALAFSKVEEGEEGRRAMSLELIWVPPLAIFDQTTALPAGDYSLRLSPKTSVQYQKAGIESSGTDKTPNSSVGTADAGADFQLNIVDMYLYVLQLTGARADNVSYLLDLKGIDCTSSIIQNAELSQTNHKVHPSTTGIAVAYQDVRSESNTLYSDSKFIVWDGSDRASDNLNRLYVSYANQSLPQPDASPSFVARDDTTAGKDYSVQMYASNQFYNGMVFSDAGGESLEDWRKRGQYYYYKFPKDPTSRDTLVEVHQSFTTGTTTTNMRVLVFSEYQQVARVVIKNGVIQSVELQSV